MYKAWTGSAEDAESLARALEAHLNEFADEVYSVGYAVTDRHHALAVYRAIDSIGSTERAVAVAESIIDEAHPVR
jgi:hypothetical protein